MLAVIGLVTLHLTFISFVVDGCKHKFMFSFYNTCSAFLNFKL